ncbi:MAG: hypothetical protein IKG46_04065 [Solobacterium sp.]|nr:hypothetical protein [Solobacterium sp.]
MSVNMNRRPMKIITAVLCIVMICGLSSCTADAAAESSGPAPEKSTEPESRSGKKIYFAGPMFSQGEKTIT